MEKIKKKTRKNVYRKYFEIRSKQKINKQSTKNKKSKSGNQKIKRFRVRTCQLTVVLR